MINSSLKSKILLERKKRIKVWERMPVLDLKQGTMGYRAIKSETECNSTTLKLDKIKLEDDYILINLL